MKYNLVRSGKSGPHQQCVDFQAPDTEPNRRPMVLDVLLQAKSGSMPDLAYRYGCSNGQCGVCTVEVNGKPKLACRTKLRQGDTISALSTLPVLRDLVVKRDAINRQLTGRIPATQFQPDSGQANNNDDYLSLNRCIKCYACLSACPLHGKNDSAQADYNNGSPFSLLKLQQGMVDPCADDSNREQASALAKDLGLDTCLDCKGCSCGVGIDLRKEVIRPLLLATELIAEPGDWPARTISSKD
jgi:succinate dehydrogenase / fumarate reductase iron-sulfur subunit